MGSESLLESTHNWREWNGDEVVFRKDLEVGVGVLRNLYVPVQTVCENRLLFSAFTRRNVENLSRQLHDLKGSLRPRKCLCAVVG